MLKIARVCDQWGWCYHFISREHAKFSRHEIIPVKYNEVSPIDYDLIYIHSPDICTPYVEKICQECKENNIPVIGGYAGDPAYWANVSKKTYDHIDLAVGISPQTYQFCVENYPGKAIFLPESIDNEFFINRGFDTSKNLVGWAGGLHKQVKRSHLLNKIKYPVMRQSKWDIHEFVEGRTQEHMVDFYNNINVLILTSITECQPRVVLEAMSCGRAVVATDVGNMRMLLDEQWIVPKSPDDVMLREMNEKLDILLTNKKLMLETSARNSNHINEYFSWKRNVQYWDFVFESVASGDIEYAIKTANFYLAKNKLDKFLR